MLRGSGSGAVFDLDLQFAAAEFSRFVRGHLLSDEESVAAAFSHVLGAWRTGPALGALLSGTGDSLS